MKFQAHLGILLLAGIFLGLPSATLAESPTSTPAANNSPAADGWLTGTSLQRALGEANRLSWSNQPLGSGLKNLGTFYEVAIWLDRRVDPTVTVDLETDPEPLAARLQQIAQSQEMGIAFLPECVYIGPPETASRLGGLIRLQQSALSGLPTDQRRRLAAKRSLTWPRLAESRDLLTERLEDYRVNVTNLDTLPFDVWDEGDYPGMDLATSLTLLLAGFNLSYQWQSPGSELELTPFPKSIRVEDSYRIPTGQKPPLANWRRDFKETEFEVSGARLLVRGDAQAHHAVAQWLVLGAETKPTGKPTRPGEKRYGLRIASATLGQAIDYLSNQLELTFEFSEEAEAMRDEQISLDVDQATLDEILKTLFDQVELEYEIDGKTVSVTTSD